MALVNINDKGSQDPNLWVLCHDSRGVKANYYFFYSSARILLSLVPLVVFIVLLLQFTLRPQLWVDDSYGKTLRTFV